MHADLHSPMRRSARYRGALIFIALFAALNVLAAWNHAYLQKKQKAELLIDESFDEPDAPARHDRSTGEALDKYWGLIPDARKQSLSVLVGMSQMYSINDRRRGDQTISEWMDDALSPRGVRVFGLAAPNLNNEEALLYLLATSAEPRTRPHAFVYGVCFDKFRNVDIRPGLQQFMSKRPAVMALWRNSAQKYAAIYPRAAEKMLATLKDMESAALKNQDETVESTLREHTAKWLPIVEARKAINAGIFAGLYNLRNWALNIKASTKRPIMGARYELNRELLELLADEAKARGIQLLPYVIPLNRSAETPYVESEYTAFRTWFRHFATARALPSADLTELVPAEEWGMRNGEPDFKHFNGAAHRRTAKALLDAFEPRLTSSPP